MRDILSLRRFGRTAFFAVVLTADLAFGQSSACVDISRDVTTAVSNDPSKVLMIVEDALVINEACAGEIIQAAIRASKADASLVNQIVQTGIAVAPKMASVITDSATAVSPGALAVSQPQPVLYDVNSSGKNPVKNPLPVEPEPVFEPVLPSIRGVYLIQPPASGIVPRDPRCRKNCDNPMSPSQSGPGYN